MEKAHQDTIKPVTKGISPLQNDGSDRKILHVFWRGIPITKRGILHGLWCTLPASCQMRLDEFLLSCTIGELFLLQRRLCKMVLDRLAMLGTKLQNATSKYFWYYLEVLIAKTSYFEYHASAPPEGDSFASLYHASIGNGLDKEDEDAGLNDEDPNANTHDTQIELASSKILGVPLEILYLFIEKLFEAFYLPGKVTADQLPTWDGLDCFADSAFCLAKSRLLRRLDPKLYARFSMDYWTYNTWFIPEGDPSYTMEFLHLISPEAYILIRSISIAFSNHHDEMAFYHAYDEDTDLLGNLYQYDDECQRATTELQNEWFWCFETLAALRLENLTLDFKNAYSSMGEFLGLTTVKDFKRFSHGLPRLVIKAPTQKLEEEIYDVLVAKNGQSY